MPSDRKALLARFRAALGEASIDHVTPELYKGAAKINRVLRNAPKGKGHVRVGRDSVKVERLPKPASLVGVVKNKLARAVLKKGGVDPKDFRWNDQLPHGEAWTAGYEKPRAKRGKHFNLGGTIAAHPRKFRDNAVTLTHELLHIKDPGKRDDDDVPYLKRRQERHAFGGSSIVGVRGLKKLGVSQELATTGLKIGSMRAVAHHKIVNEPSANVIGRTIRRNIHRKKLNLHYTNFDGVDGYLGGLAGERPRRKMAKELYKGIERTYGARNTSGGSVNKFGRVKLATPISRLPESREELIASILEAYDDHKVSINKYGQVNFTQVDRGKPGDYTFWEKHKAQNKPVVRPKEASARPKLHRAKAEQPKPSTARDRALAWQRKHAALGEASIDHFTPNLYKTARRFERDIRKAKFMPHERDDLKHNREVKISSRKINPTDKDPVHLKLGGIRGMGDHVFSYYGKEAQDLADMGAGGIYRKADKVDSIRLNAGHASNQRIPWQGDYVDKKVAERPQQKVVWTLSHELGHATDSAFDFSPKKQGPKAKRSYHAYSPNQSKLLAGEKQRGLSLYVAQSGEGRQTAMDAMFGIHRGKIAGISRADALDGLRTGAGRVARPYALRAMNRMPDHDDAKRKEAYDRAEQDIGLYNLASVGVLGTHQAALKKLGKKAETEVGLTTRERKQQLKMKKGYRKLAKETHKAIERKYGPVRTRIKGNLPEGLLEQVLISVDSRVGEG